MTAAAVVLISFGCGFAACWILLVRPSRRLLKRWMAFYEHDIEAAKERQTS